MARCGRVHHDRRHCWTRVFEWVADRVGEGVLGRHWTCMVLARGYRERRDRPHAQSIFHAKIQVVQERNWLLARHGAGRAIIGVFGHVREAKVRESGPRHGRRRYGLDRHPPESGGWGGGRSSLWRGLGGVGEWIRACNDEGPDFLITAAAAHET